jgi:hypothetical protein
MKFFIKKINKLALPTIANRLDIVGFVYCPKPKFGDYVLCWNEQRGFPLE